MDARTIANYLIYITSDVLNDMTNMKLNKLLYFAQGHYLSKYQKPLFDDPIEAWKHGPVVPSVYSAYKPYGRKTIRDYDINLVADVTPEMEEVLYGVARKYGRYTASALRSMTHVIGSPWDRVYRSGKDKEIPLSMIQAYYADAEELGTAEKTFTDEDFVGYRDKDGFLVLPKELDDGEV